MTTVDMFTRTGDDELDVDRNFEPIREGQRDPVVLRFHFDERWKDREIKILSILNGSRVYSMPMRSDEATVPAHMLAEGSLKLIVRGYLVTKDLDVVSRGGHILMTDEARKGDLPGYTGTDKLGGFTLSDHEVGYEAWARMRRDGDFVLSDEVVNTEFHDIPPASESETGYIEAHVLDEGEIYVGRKQRR